MEVTWTNAAGAVEHWSSWTDPFCGWFEAEKVLSSSVTNILVQFKVQTVWGTPDVCAVSRPESCRWVADAATGSSFAEVFRLRDSDSGSHAPVDAHFELAGP